MKYHYEQKPIAHSGYGETYICDHPVYSRCTLYRVRDKGLAVIQQHFDPQRKYTYWAEIDSVLVDDIYIQPAFYSFFMRLAAEEDHGLYPTVTVRQIMWALKMKPLKRERWETVFDHKPI